eukprot:1020560-Rhodomonas_salina.4
MELLYRICSHSQREQGTRKQDRLACRGELTCTVPVFVLKGENSTCTVFLPGRKTVPGTDLGLLRSEALRVPSE